MSQATEREVSGDGAPQRAAAETPSQNGTTPESPPNLDMMSKTLSALQDQVKFADTKASFIAGLNILLCGFVVDSAQKLAIVPSASRATAFYCAWVLLILYGAATLVSVAHVAFTIIPRFGHSAPRSRTHFSHVVAIYGKDHGTYCKDILSMTPLDWAHDIGGQIIQVAHIAHTKHRLVRAAVLWTLVALVFWVGGMIAMLVAR